MHLDADEQAQRRGLSQVESHFFAQPQAFDHFLGLPPDPLFQIGPDFLVLLPHRLGRPGQAVEIRMVHQAASGFAGGEKFGRLPIEVMSRGHQGFAVGLKQPVDFPFQAGFLRRLVHGPQGNKHLVPDQGQGRLMIFRG